MASVASTVKTCPSCAADLPEPGPFKRWCSSCDWNIENEEREYVRFIRKTSRFDKALKRLGDRHACRQFDALYKRDEGELRPTFTGVKMFGYALAGTVVLVFLLLLALGIYLSWPLQFPATLVGIFLVLFCLLVLPRPGKLVERELITVRDAPALFTLIVKVSTALGCPMPDHVAIDADFNASFGTVGWRRRTVLTLGLPLWSVLGAQERVCVIGHELAHGINGDPARGFILHTALRALFGWAATIHPSTLMGRHPNLLIALAEIPFRVLLVLIAKAIEAVALGLLALIWHESQRAEYLADALGARVGGTKATVSSLERLSCGEYIQHIATRTSYDLPGARDFFLAFGDFVNCIPELELERQRRLLERQELRFDSSHPPTSLRMLMLARHLKEPIVTLSGEDSGRIDAELAPLRDERQDWLLAKLFPYR